MLILTLFPRILDTLTGTDKRCSILQCKSKDFYKFCASRSKLISEICQNVGNLDGKTKQNHLKAPTLSPFTQKSAVFIENRLFIVKINVQ